MNPLIYQAYSQGAGACYNVDLKDASGPSVDPPLPSVVRVNDVNSEDPAARLSLSLRTQEEPNQTLHSVKGYDTATGVGTPSGAAFFNMVAKEHSATREGVRPPVGGRAPSQLPRQQSELPADAGF